MERADLELVLAIKDTGSLTQAATRLRLSAPVVTKRLAALEAALGLKLFFRTTRSVAPTAEGDVLCERAAPLLAQFVQTEEALRDHVREIAGPIRLAATFGFGRIWLGPALAQFQMLHPAVRIDLQLTEKLPDLGADGFDGAVWLWPASASRAAQWSERKLASNQRVLVAAPSYLTQRKAPQTLADLSDHECLVVRESDEPSHTWNLQPIRRSKDKKPNPVHVKGSLSRQGHHAAQPVGHRPTNRQRRAHSRAAPIRHGRRRHSVARPVQSPNPSARAPAERLFKAIVSKCALGCRVRYY